MKNTQEQQNLDSNMDTETIFTDPNAASILSTVDINWFNSDDHENQFDTAGGTPELILQNIENLAKQLDESTLSEITLQLEHFESDILKLDRTEAEKTIKLKKLLDKTLLSDPRFNYKMIEWSSFKVTELMKEKHTNLINHISQLSMDFIAETSACELELIKSDKISLERVLRKNMAIILEDVTEKTLYLKYLRTCKTALDMKRKDRLIPNTRRNSSLFINNTSLEKPILEPFITCESFYIQTTPPKESKNTPKKHKQKNTNTTNEKKKKTKIEIEIVDTPPHSITTPTIGKILKKAKNENSTAPLNDNLSLPPKGFKKAGNNNNGKNDNDAKNRHSRTVTSKVIDKGLGVGADVRKQKQRSPFKSANVILQDQTNRQLSTNFQSQQHYQPLKQTQPQTQKQQFQYFQEQQPFPSYGYLPGGYPPISYHPHPNGGYPPTW